MSESNAKTVPEKKPFVFARDHEHAGVKYVAEDPKRNRGEFTADEIAWLKKHKADKPLPKT